MSQFLEGFRISFEGFKIFKAHKRAFSKWIFIPFILDVLLISITASLLFYGVQVANFEWVQVLPNWVLKWINSMILVALTLIAFFVFFSLHILLASPFYSVISERALKISGHQFPHRSFLGWLVLTARMSFLAIIKSLIFLAVVGLLWVFSFFIPPLAFITMAWPFLTLAYDSMDYCLEVKEAGLFSRFSFFAKHLPFFLGLSCFLFISNILPLIGIIIALPFAIIGSASYLQKQTRP